MTLNEILEICPKDKIIVDNIIRAYSKINSSKYKKIVCTISGGADSDIVIDICTKMDNDNKITYVWFDTGLEYEATKEHLKYLEIKYNISIKVEKAIKAIPTTCKQYGQPFISKNVSEMISRLQKHEFKWEDGNFDELLEKYCTEVTEENAIINGKLKKGISKVNERYWKGCVSALEWWCNAKKSAKMGICQNKLLKEFMIENPPEQPISNKCCKYAKKDLAHKVINNGQFDLEITGIRKAEGGARSTAYKSCFDESYENCDRYRPIFWYLNDTKIVYEDHYEIKHSCCYTEYGLKRTGCAGCPFGRDFEFELEVIERYEPKLFKAVNEIFKYSYEYTRSYRDFCNRMNQKTR
ncbi:phosphoadenosine phosphosulfate reductase family protein [Clostridium sp.]|jgi:3'-phosphoadenosine 5'-phosphosulfate sulfotransferase (PAPS reductase)/FAD synthetase|uniref:phosphoadenosine phosphosulfate reductase domain-containing protein n=1 Tax=Clostridium sp. TaxID=1506 RepID=UPI00258E619A|nr:phosphoadenosine phosphosulfate reductase family protein [Clostridium sp.]MDF2505921.1 putative phosphoadenosine phosphosulfate reductase family [Clostridium sp.]